MVDLVNFVFYQAFLIYMHYQREKVRAYVILASAESDDLTLGCKADGKFRRGKRALWFSA